MHTVAKKQSQFKVAVKRFCQAVQATSFIVINSTFYLVAQFMGF